MTVLFVIVFVFVAYNQFPKDFENIVKNIFRRMFRMYGHIYFSHFPDVQQGGAEAHLNSCFKHFMYFVLEFDLVDEKQIRMMKKVINRLKIMPEIR